MSEWPVMIPLWIMAVVVLSGAVVVVVARNLFRAALSLGVVLVGVAGFFVLLEAEFLAFVQILVYVGAILMLVIFAIMLTPRDFTDPGARQDPAATGRPSHSPVTAPQPTGVRTSQVVNRGQGPAAVVAGGLFLLFAWTIYHLPWPAAGPEAVSLRVLGEELISTLVLPFEVVSLAFVVAMIGAIAVAFSSSSRGRPGPSASQKT